MMNVSEGANNKTIFECTDCDECLPCKNKATADGLLDSHPRTYHHRVMAGLPVQTTYGKAKADVVAS